MTITLEKNASDTNGETKPARSKLYVTATPVNKSPRGGDRELKRESVDRKKKFVN